MRGTVKFFDRKKGFGVIVPVEQTSELRFHLSALLEPLPIPLSDGEEVEFELGDDLSKGKVAVAVRRLYPRYRGTVERYEKGYGWIRRDDNNHTVYAHHTEIVNGGAFKRLEEGEEVEFYIETNDRGLAATRIFRVDMRTRLFRFAEMGRYDEAVEAIRRLAEPEDWNYRHSQSTKPYPILRSYLTHTFDRLEKEEKITQVAGAQGQRLACFNSGLVTARQEAIFAVFSQREGLPPRDPPWSFEGFYKESERILSFFASKPDIANYFSDPGELLYDSRLQLVPNVDHIIGDNRERFPSELRSNEYALRGAVVTAIDSAKHRVRRNYKAAIPSYYRGKMQLLLPLCLITPERADLALVVSRENQVYLASTVLTLDMAYNNARLIAKPDREWLDP